MPWTSVCYSSLTSDCLTWRLLPGLGAIPGLAVFYLRRQTHETRRFTMAGGPPRKPRPPSPPRPARRRVAHQPRRLGRRGIDGEGPADAARIGMVLTIALPPHDLSHRGRGRRIPAALRRRGHLPGVPGQGTRTRDLAGPPLPQLSPAVCRSTPVTDGYFCRHESSRAICASLALSTR